jgi:hypothetical protein
MPQCPFCGGGDRPSGRREGQSPSLRRRGERRGEKSPAPLPKSRPIDRHLTNRHHLVPVSCGSVGHLHRRPLGTTVGAGRVQRRHLCHLCGVGADFRGCDAWDLRGGVRRNGCPHLCQMGSLFPAPPFALRLVRGDRRQWVAALVQVARHPSSAAYHRGRTLCRLRNRRASRNSHPRATADACQRFGIQRGAGRRSDGAPRGHGRPSVPTRRWTKPSA